MLLNVPAMYGVLTHRANDNGTVELLSEYYDGSKGLKKLEERGGNIFYVPGDRFGQRYRLVTRTGNLQLIDNDGLIRTAKRLGNSPQPNECGPR